MTNKTSSPESWLEEHGDYLYNYAIFRLREPHAAEDAVQETLLAALRARASFRGQGSERTWLVGILKHKIMDHFRGASRWQSIDIENEATDYDPFQSSGELAGHWTSHHAPTEWHTSAAALVENKAFWTVLRDGLAGLPHRTATAFVLREVDGCSTEEICDALDISRENLWVMLHRARVSLRRFLEVNWFAVSPGTTELKIDRLSTADHGTFSSAVSFAAGPRLTA